MRKLTKKDRAIMELLQENIQSTMKLTLKNKSPGSKKHRVFRPFFASLVLREIAGPGIAASDGSVMLASHPVERKKFIRSELRVGSYNKGGSVKRDSILFIPENYDSVALKRKMWLDINNSMYEVVRDLNEKNTKAIGVPEKFHSFVYFSKEKKEVYFKPVRFPKFDLKFWSGILSRVSKIFISGEVIDSFVAMSTCFEKRYFVNSEGTCIIDGTNRINLEFRAKTRCEDNTIIENSESLWFLNMNQTPSEKEMTRIAKKLLVELKEIKEAPVEKAGTYPTIVDGVNHGVIWHEAVGHSLEGGRQDEKDDGYEDDGFWEEEEDETSLTFKGKIGELIAPKFFTIYDDPTVPGYDGSYRYDEEGVESQKVILVENGILKNYLHSRETAGKLGSMEKKQIKSNGHGRTEVAVFFGGASPRMGNLFVESNKKYSMKKLKEMLFAECRRRGIEYGLLLKSNLGGFVDFEGSYFHVFPKHIFRLYLDGRVERVRGLFIVNTPYQLLENIVATSDQTGVFRGECGAESGWVATTTSAPDAFIRSVEYGILPRSAYRKCYPFLSKPPIK